MWFQLFHVVWIVALLLVLRRINRAQDARHKYIKSASREKFFVYAKLLDTVLPIERGTKYADPLDAALAKRQFGEVTGGGTMQDKDGTIEFVGLDIELVNLGSALEFTRQTLRDLGAPKGSVLEYERDGESCSTPIWN